jgi:hypothetical protein
MNEEAILKSLSRPEISTNHQFCELVVELLNNNKNYSSIKSMLSGYRASRIGSLYCEAVEIEQEVQQWGGYCFMTLAFPPNWQSWVKSPIISGTDKKQHTLNEAQSRIKKFHKALGSNFYTPRRLKAGTKLRAIYIPGGDLKTIDLHFHALVEVPKNIDFDGYATIAKKTWATINSISSNSSFFDIENPQTEDLIRIAFYLLKNEQQSASLGIDSRLHYKTTYAPRKPI